LPSDRRLHGGTQHPLGRADRGTLIVGCSIALGLSLWTKLEQIEFPSVQSPAANTSALFGAGFYTLHHWKLECDESRLALIATLLVPLDFLCWQA